MTRRQGRSAPVQAADDFIPMSRAELRHARRSGRGQYEIASRGTVSSRHPSFGSNEHPSRFAYSTRFAAMRGSAPPVQWSSPLHAARGSSDFAANRSAARNLPFASAPGSGLAVPSARENVFAQGVSHPDDDERMPREPNGYAGANIGTAEVIVAPFSRGPAASNSQPSSGGAQPQVVQGFGSEVAVVPSDPVTTRRRNHPISAAALPGMTPPPTLEERDSITEAAVSPAVLPEIYDRDGRLLMPAPLKGSREVLIHQNTMANGDGLERIRDDGELDRLRANQELVNFPVGDSLQVNSTLPYNRRCARPWTVIFATEIAHDFYNRFHQPLVVTSAVRTVNYQMRLQRVNGNAAAVDGDAASPHLTGQALDLAKRGMSAAQLAWMRAYLMPLMSAGKIDVEEEFQQACFHISVYRRYTAGRRSMQFAQVRSATHIEDTDSSLP